MYVCQLPGGPLLLAPFRQLSSKRDNEPQPILGISQFRLIHEPLPIEIGKPSEHPRKRFENASVHVSFGYVMALIATQSALVLGLLIASAKGSYDSFNEGFRQSAARAILLDRALAQYGPEASGVRSAFKAGLSARVHQLAPRHHSAKIALKSSEATEAIEALERSIRSLSPSNDAQRSLQAKALTLVGDIEQSRWMGIEHEDNSVPAAFLVVLVFWLSAMFGSFGLFAPRNAVAITVMFVGALSLSAAIYLIEALNNPLEGLISISRAPLEMARSQLGR